MRYRQILDLIVILCDIDLLLVLMAIHISKMPFIIHLLLSEHCQNDLDGYNAFLKLIYLNN